MSASRWSRLKEIVQGALELEPDERAAFLAEACGDDAVLLREAEELLEGADSAEPGFLEPPDLEPESAAGLRGAASSAAPLRLGEFELLEEVGRGGVGVVYRARQIGLDRIVAVKVLETGLATSEQAILRFEHEARAVAKLHHEGIVPIYAVGVDGVNHWFAMEFVQGGDLAQELQRQRLGRGHQLPLPGSPGHASSVAERMRSVARALQVAHDVGVVHRDVKPQNLLIGEDGNLRLADFGLAKDASQGSISLSGELLGTPYYMSPEQARARRESIDHRTDVYSAGAVLYEMLTLRRPFEGDTVQEVLADITDREPAPIRRYNGRVPRDLELICAKAMAKSVEERYASAGDFADDLDRLLNLEAVQAQAPSFLARLRRGLHRRRRLLFGAAAVVAALLIGGAFARAGVQRGADARLAADLGAWLEVEDWSDREGELALLRGRLERRDEGGARLPAELDERARAWRGRLEAHVEGLVRQGGALREVGLGQRPTAGGATTPSEPRDLFLGLQMLQRALVVAPDAPELAALADVVSAYPTLTLELDPETVAEAGTEAFEVGLVLPDPLRGGRLERLPLELRPGVPTRVPPGRYRIRVDVEGFGGVELSRAPDWGEALAFVVRVPAPGRARAGMLRIPAGSITPRPGPDALERGSGPGCFVHVERVEVASFWIDAAEVSNAEYLEFVRATGHRPPALWDMLGFESSFDDLELGDDATRFGELPVTTVSVPSARAFAEWRGKRLLTHRELEYVLRGSDGSFYPPADVGARADSPGGTGFSANVSGAALTRTSDFPALLEGYLQNVLPVRAPGYAQPPFGLWHAFGNVRELTDSVPIALQGARVRTFPGSVVVLGNSWASEVDAVNLASHETLEDDEFFTPGPSTGFRCALSEP